VFDHGSDVAGPVAERTSGQPASAGLVAWEPSPVGEEDAGAAAGKVDRSGRPGWAGADDEDVEALHAVILDG
jgi:hypothetical protein